MEQLSNRKTLSPATTTIDADAGNTINRIRNTFNKNKGGVLNKQLKYPLVAILMIILSVGFTACKEPPPDDPPVYENILAGTEWKLVHLFDSETNTIKILEPDFVESAYVVLFATDTTVLKATTTNNRYICDYSINYFDSTINFLQCTFMTYAPENYPDALLFFDGLTKMQSFSFTEEELKLFYNDKKNYLLLKRSFIFN